MSDGIKNVASKVAWMARATTTVVGLAIMLALVLGVASTALGKDGNPLILGKANNVATKVTGLIGKVATGEALSVENPSGGEALGLSVGDPLVDPADKTVAPMKVDSQARVDNLNADQLDGEDSADFAPSTHLHDDRYSTQEASDSRYVNETDHNKAAHDAMNIDADTLDGKDSTQFVSTSTYTRTTTITAVAGQFRTGTANCDTGDKVLSGGFFGINDADDYVQASYPTLSDPQGWYIQLRSGATADNLTVYVLCSNV